jgi:3-methyladenine DNA glycosylase AlkD
VLAKEEYLYKIILKFKDKAMPDKALHMKQYMQNHFLFLGIQRPLRRTLMKSFMQKEARPAIQLLPSVLMTLWELPYREFQYAAMDLMEKYNHNLNETHIPLLQTLITTKSWWDTVDLLARKSVGSLLKNHPNLIPVTTDRWIHSENIWLKRTCLLFQLSYKENTDTDLLFYYIKLLTDSNEFFIQKAIGWALREYSKINIKIIQDFINSNSLSPLSIREALKFIKKI